MYLNVFLSFAGAYLSLVSCMFVRLGFRLFPGSVVVTVLYVKFLDVEGTHRPVLPTSGVNLVFVMCRDGRPITLGAHLGGVKVSHPKSVTKKRFGIHSSGRVFLTLLCIGRSNLWCRIKSLSRSFDDEIWNGLIEIGRWSLI